MPTGLVRQVPAPPGLAAPLRSRSGLLAFRLLGVEAGQEGADAELELQSPERDVLLVSALISIIVVLAFTDWGVLAYVATGLVFAVLLLGSAIANRRRRAPRR